jgi:hypothetical protein
MGESPVPEEPHVFGPGIKAVHIHVRQDGTEDCQEPEPRGQFPLKKSLPQGKGDESMGECGSHKKGVLGSVLDVQVIDLIV